MRSLIICATLVIAVFVSDARTDALANWCAVYQIGGTNCGFATHAQCMATVSGVGGLCNESPDAGAATAKSAHVRRERPVRNQKVVNEAPSAGIALSIGIGGGIPAGRRGGHHGGSKPYNNSLTNVKNSLPPGFQ